MKSLYAAVTEAREVGTNRRLCDLFMVKPSKKDYPDYYKVILEPMDLKTIEHNIRNERYPTEEALMDDMKLMFRNARHYNEEGSQVGRAPNEHPVSLLLLSRKQPECELCCPVKPQVYNDADILEKILKDKRKELGPPPDEEEVGALKLKPSEFLSRVPSRKRDKDSSLSQILCW